MPLYALSKQLIFPPIDEAEPDGLLAIGGDLSVQRILLAYRSGIFPWYEGETILWWSPDPRFILFPQKLRVSKSMKAVLKKELFEFRFNTAFAATIRKCRKIRRHGQPEGTWIDDDVEIAYNELHQAGYAISAEAWQNNKLVGGLYGVQIGKIFYGESMFSEQTNASKFAFIRLVGHLREQDCRLIDCQVYTEHLESLGAEMISRKTFVGLLKQYNGEE